MSIGVINRDGGKTDEAGHVRPLFKLLQGNIITGFKVTQRAAGINLSVDVSKGDGKIDTTTGYSYGIFNDTDANNVAITTANGSNPRNDIIVAYIDLAQARSTLVSNNTNGVLKIIAVPGTPAGSPVDPSDPTIQTAVGASNPWIKLARVLVGTSVTTISNAVITDLRTMAGALEDPAGYPATFRQALYNFFEAAGCIWSGDSYASTRNASMTAGFVWINGKRLTVAAVTARAFTASKDTYVDASDNGDGTALLAYNEVTNNAASPALAAGAVRMAIIVTGASNIANVGSINQGQPDKVLPIASSIPYQVTDSLGNLIYNRTPVPTQIGYRQVVTNQGSITATVDLTGLNVTVLVPAGRRVKVSYFVQMANNAGATFSAVNILQDGTLVVGEVHIPSLVANSTFPGVASVVLEPSAGSHTYKLTSVTNSGTGTLSAASNNPNFIMVELV